MNSWSALSRWAGSNCPDYLCGQPDSDLAVGCLYGDMWTVANCGSFIFSLYGPCQQNAMWLSILWKAWWGGGGEMMDTHRDAPPSSRRDSRLFLQVRRVAAWCKHFGVLCTTSVCHVFVLLGWCQHVNPLPSWLPICPPAPLCFFLMSSWSLASKPTLVKWQTTQCNTAAQQQREKQQEEKESIVIEKRHRSEKREAEEGERGENSWIEERVKKSERDKKSSAKKREEIAQRSPRSSSIFSDCCCC